MNDFHDGYVDLARTRFARVNGWQFTKRAFSLDMLSRGEGFLDECGGRPFFKLGSAELYTQNDRPVAIVGHVNDSVGMEYCDVAEAMLLALKFGLVAHVAPARASWCLWRYDFGVPQLVAITRRPSPLTSSIITRFEDIVWPTEAEMRDISDAVKIFQDAKDKANEEAEDAQAEYQGD